MSTETDLCDKIARLFWFSVVWTFGSTVNERGQHLFNDFIHNLSENFSSQDWIFNFGLDEHLQWTEWSNLLPTTWSLNERFLLKRFFFIDICIYLASKNIIIRIY